MRCLLVEVLFKLEKLSVSTANVTQRFNFSINHVILSDIEIKAEPADLNLEIESQPLEFAAQTGTGPIT